jgi:hypothetical protein
MKPATASDDNGARSSRLHEISGLEVLVSDDCQRLRSPSFAQNVRALKSSAEHHLGYPRGPNRLGGTPRS